MENKICQSCKISKTLDNYHKNQKWCKECKNAIRREKRRLGVGCYKDEYLKNRTKHLETCKKRHRRNKIKVINHYSQGKMVCGKCNFSDLRALSIDHINGDGAKHRREDKYMMGSGLYLWLIRNNFPPQFQVLCMNCQFIKRHENNEVTKGYFTRKNH